MSDKILKEAQKAVGSLDKMMGNMLKTMIPAEAIESMPDDLKNDVLDCMSLINDKTKTTEQKMSILHNKLGRHGA